jgi:hypothetical protein
MFKAHMDPASDRDALAQFELAFARIAIDQASTETGAA